MSKAQLSKLMQLGGFLGGIVRSLEDSGLLLKEVSETIKNEAKEQKGGFLGMLLGTLSAILLGNMLTGKGVIRAGEGTARSKRTARSRI